MSVPEVLLSGNHQEIARWEEEQSLRMTQERRKDIFDSYREKYPEEDQAKKKKKR